jgi:hypothetical protein
MAASHTINGPFGDKNCPKGKFIPKWWKVHLFSRCGTFGPAMGPVGYIQHSADFGGVQGGKPLASQGALSQKPTFSPLQTGSNSPPVTESGVTVVGNGSAGVPEPRCGSGWVHATLPGRRRGHGRHPALLRGAHGAKDPPRSNSTLCDGKWANCRWEWFGRDP